MGRNIIPLQPHLAGIFRILERRVKLDPEDSRELFLDATDPLTRHPDPPCTIRAATLIRVRLPAAGDPVDNNVETARGLVRLLKLLGNEVEAAHDGIEVLEKSEEFRPEFVLLDIGLPGMDGYEVATRPRGDGCCPDVVIIALSGYGQDEDRRRSEAAGFHHHLVKPLHIDAIASLIRRAGSSLSWTTVEERGCSISPSPSWA